MYRELGWLRYSLAVWYVDAQNERTNPVPFQKSSYLVTRLVGPLLDLIWLYHIGCLLNQVFLYTDIGGQRKALGLVSLLWLLPIYLKHDTRRRVTPKVQCGSLIHFYYQFLQLIRGVMLLVYHWVYICTSARELLQVTSADILLCLINSLAFLKDLQVWLSPLLRGSFRPVFSFCHIATSQSSLTRLVSAK